MVDRLVDRRTYNETGERELMSMESAGYIEGGGLDGDLVIGVAAVMRHRAASIGGTEKLGERRDLEPVTAAVLSEAFPKRVVRDHKYNVLAWPKVGRVDVVVKEANGVLFASHLIELKWSGPGGDKIVEWSTSCASGAGVCSHAVAIVYTERRGR